MTLPPRRSSPEPRSAPPAPSAAPAPCGPLRLHVGAGRERLEGWLNLDLQQLPGVDRVVDVTLGLDFADVEAIFAEHFLEHLPVDEALGFLVECQRVLRPGGRLRLSTPNLDWVIASHSRREATTAAEERRALHLNRAFYGWRHRFLWNRPLLARALAAAGFDDLRWHRYGESDEPTFRGLERHATYEDVDGLPHVIIAEGRRGERRPQQLAETRILLYDELLSHLDD